jgi:acetylornithine/N-succinyldiaminopimelate aminotransferase
MSISDNAQSTMHIEDRLMAPFFKKLPVSIDRGKGVYVWDERGRRYLDFTSGWGVTCLGHAHPVIIEALLNQSRKIIQNPNSGLTYSPARARLLAVMEEILPKNLTRVFFSNSGAESNDAAIKLARKVTQRTDIVSTQLSFHGRTISTASATGQSSHRDRFNPLMPNNRFVPYNDIKALKEVLDDRVAAFILEPVQGEGGVNVPSDGYLEAVSALCRENNSLLIMDEIQTGFCRTGPMFAVSGMNVEPDFITMAKGIAGGFPFGAFAMSERVVQGLEIGDHGGTYCGNPLGCAVAHAVIRYLLDEHISDNVFQIGDFAKNTLMNWIASYPGILTGVRGKGLLLALELKNDALAGAVCDDCLTNGLFVRQTHGNVIRIFPALNITRDEMQEGLDVLKSSIESAAKRSAG